MEVVFEKPFSLILVMIVAYVLKSCGVFKKESFSILSAIIFKFSLPCAVITYLSTVEFEISMLLIIPIGILLNIVTVFIGWAINVKSPQNRPFDMLNLSGFNIGAFGLPFVMSFLGPRGIMAACLFDAGNSVMCTGGTYALVSSIKYSNQGKGGLKISEFIKRLVSSIPFDFYVIMSILRIFDINMPSMVLNFCQIGANANPFLCMVLLGIGINLKMNKNTKGHVFKILAIRFSFNIICIIMFSQMTFFPQEIREALILVSATPIAAMAAVFTGIMEEDLEMSSSINSISIIFSTVLMLVLMILIS